MREGSGYSFRAMFLIDSEGGVVAREVGDLPSGLGAREAKRLVMCHAGKTAVESLNMGMGGLALRPGCQGSKEIGHVPCRQDCRGVFEHGDGWTCPQAWVPGKQRDWSCAMQARLPWSL